MHGGSVCYRPAMAVGPATHCPPIKSRKPHADGARLLGAASCEEATAPRSAPAAMRLECGAARAALTSLTTGRSTTPASKRAFRIGQRAARSLSERWPAEPLAGIHLLRFKAIDARMIFVEAAMNAPRSPTLPQWKIDLVQEVIRILEGEKMLRVTAAMIARRIPSLSITDIDIAVRLLQAQDRREKRKPRPVC
jgi:hypothetical protein